MTEETTTTAPPEEANTPAPKVHLIDTPAGEVDAFLSSHSIYFRRMEGSGLLVLVDDVDSGAGRTQAEGDRFVVVDPELHRAEFAPEAEAPPVEEEEPRDMDDDGLEAQSAAEAEVDVEIDEDEISVTVSLLRELCDLHVMSVTRRRDMAERFREIFASQS